MVDETQESERGGGGGAKLMPGRRIDLHAIEGAQFVDGTTHQHPSLAAQDHGLPEVKNVPGAEVLFLHDEHATIALPAESTISVGDRIELWPSHIDPTINLHDVMYAVEGDEVVEVWPIAARGYLEQRQ